MRVSLRNSVPGSHSEAMWILARLLARSSRIPAPPNGYGLGLGSGTGLGPGLRLGVGVGPNARGRGRGRARARGRARGSAACPDEPAGLVLAHKLLEHARRRLASGGGRRAGGMGVSWLGIGLGLGLA